MERIDACDTSHPKFPQGRLLFKKPVAIGISDNESAKNKKEVYTHKSFFIEQMVEIGIDSVNMCSENH